MNINNNMATPKSVKKIKTIKERAVDTALSVFKALIGLLGERKTASVSARIVEKISPVIMVKTKMGRIKFHCPGEIAMWRAETLLTKEADTIEWIDGFNGTCVFWDVGANVGTYSLYAALRPGIKVLAFEPSAFNYYLLNKNIQTNDMEGSVASLCVAFSDSTRLGGFYMENTEFGGALNNFGEAMDWKKEAFDPSYRQGMIGLSIDDFVEKFNPPFPDYIKIDVDGIEPKIIAGARKTLSDKRLKSILIELNTADTKEYRNVIAFIEESGFKIRNKGHSAVHGKDRFGSVCNHIFFRSNLIGPV